MPRTGEDVVDALARDVELAAKFTLARPSLVRFEYGLTEVLAGSVEALEGLVAVRERRRTSLRTPRRTD